MLEAHQVSLSLGGARILDDVTVSARPGEVLALCGPNGAGKSTLLSVLSGERGAETGGVTLAGAPVSGLSPLELARRRAVLEQHPAIELAFTVEELVRLGAASSGVEAQFDLEGEVRSAILRAGVAGLTRRRADTLSGGERHRAHFARVLVQIAAGRAEGGGHALLLDEPTASLDLSHQAAVMRTAREVAAEGVAVVVVLHDLNLAAAFADKIVLLAAGRLVGCGTADQTLTSELLSEIYGVQIAVRLDPTGRPEVRPVFFSSAEGVTICTSR